MTAPSASGPVDDAMGEEMPFPGDGNIEEMQRMVEEQMRELSNQTDVNADEFDAFQKRVDDATRLLAGLKEGTISPEYIDQVVEKEAKVTQAKAKAKEIKQEQDDEHKEERLAKARERVLEIQESLRRKEAARARYAAWVLQEQERSNHTKKATDYTAWDLWTPSDEEDDMVRNLQPAGAEFAAMEKDIAERHRRVKEQRRIAERCRVEGNAAFQRGQFSTAYQHYAEGLEHHKANVVLHGNAALASIKQGCYVQAIEHCDRVMSIQEFLEQNLKVNRQLGNPNAPPPQRP